MKCLTVLLMLLVMVIGCEPQSQTDYRSAIACELALVSMGSDEAPSPTPNTTDKCDGSGWITQGDGHKTKCPGCPACTNDSGDLPGGILGISDATKAVKDTCEKVDAVIDKLMDGGLNIKVGDEPPKPPTWGPVKPACPDGQCPTRTVRVPVTATVRPAQRVYTQPRRLFWRFRR